MADYFDSRNELLERIRKGWRGIAPDILKPARKPANRLESFICPYCGHGDGGDGLTEIPGSNGTLKCFGCGWTGDIVDIIRSVKWVDFNSALDYAADKLCLSQGLQKHSSAQVTPKEQAQILGFPQKTKASDGRTEALNDGFYSFADIIDRANEAALSSKEALKHYAARGFDEKAIKQFKLGYAPDGMNAFLCDFPEQQQKTSELKHFKYIIPYAGGGYFVAESADREKTTSKYRFPKDIKKPLFVVGEPSVDFPVIICEGQYDALSFSALGFPCAIATGGTIGNALAEWAAGRVQRVILAADNDNQGRSQRDKLRESLESKGIECITLDEARLYGGEKDANAAFVYSTKREDMRNMIKARVIEQDIINIRRENAEIARKAVESLSQLNTTNRAPIVSALSGTNQLDSFIRNAQTRYMPIQTGFTAFDRLMNGGFVRQSLVMLGAASAMGKTTLATQLLEGAALNGANVLYINLEMSTNQLIARALSRYAFLHGAHNLTATHIMRGNEWTDADREIINKAVAGYKRDIAERFLYVEADRKNNITADIDDIMNYLNAAASKAAAAGIETPIVCIDYLHLLTSKSASGRDDDARTTIKRAVTELKAYAVEHNTAVLVILANNREANKEKALTLESGRDSSNIEYSADCFIGLNFTNWEDDKAESKIASAVLKKRKPRQLTLKLLKARMWQDCEDENIYFDAEHSLFCMTKK